MAVSPASATGSTPLTGTVTITAPAPTGGAVVTLASANPTAVSLPTSVTLAAGQSTASFTVQTHPVGASTEVVVTGTRLNLQRTATVTVQPPALLSVAVSPSSLPGGGVAVGTVTVSAPAPTGGTAVSLSSSVPDKATVPTGVTIPAGATSATFRVQTYTVTGSTAVTLTASYNGANPTAALTVTP